jgi:predicted nucleic acid-binding protein
VIVVDTSAWIEYIRATESSVHQRLSRTIDEREQFAVTEIVFAELLSGTRDDLAERRLRRTLRNARMLRLRGLRDFEAAAQLSRACRREGDTIRGIADCLVAVPAILAGAPVLHADRDFDVLARHTPLEVVPLDD